MVRSALSKIAWVGRTASMVFGLALVLALLFGVASMALGANGNPWILGKTNVATAITVLGGRLGVDGPMVRLTNNNGGTNDTALHLQVQSGEPPMRVDSPTKVSNLNSDQLDGKDQRAFADVSELGGQVPVHIFGPLPVERTFTSNGGTLVILASGSGYRGGGTDRNTGRIAMNVRVNGSSVGRADVFAEEPNLHETFVDEYSVVEGLPAGTHTIRLEANYDDDDCNTADETTSTICTATNSQDFFRVVVLELSD